MHTATLTNAPHQHATEDARRRGQAIFFWANMVFLAGTGLLALAYVASV